MLWFCRQDSRAFTFCSHWEQTVKRKSLIYSERRTFVKMSIRPRLRIFPCLGGVPQQHVSTKSTGTSLALWASSELAVLRTAAPSPRPVRRRLWEPSHAHWERVFQAFCFYDWTHCQAPTDPQIHEGSRPVYLSLHLRMNPQSGSRISSSGELKHSRRLHRKSPCCSAQVTFSAKAVKTTTAPASKSLQWNKETPNPFGCRGKPPAMTYS